MFEYHKNKINEINSIPNNLSVEENLYFRDFYLKDFKYISPDVVNLNKNKVINKDVEKVVINEKLGAKSMLEKWISEVMKGLKQFFYQGSLHGVKLVVCDTWLRKFNFMLCVVVFGRCRYVGNDILHVSFNFFLWYKPIATTHRHPKHQRHCQCVIGFLGARNLMFIRESRIGKIGRRGNW